MRSVEKQTELTKIREKIANCFDCQLSSSRANTVPGEGNPDAEILFIGEAPGATEDREGKPFCGQSGKFLDQLLAKIELSRSDIFITNTCKCRPPENRDPLPEEKAACRKFLDQQLQIIKPKIIVCLGKHSVETYLPEMGGIAKMHGKPFVSADGRVYLALYHPAAALHNGGLRQTLIDDFMIIPTLLK
ncbi:MAG: uracil-DNA glycosylase [Candidatus Berkelbacteria bacterium]